MLSEFIAVNRAEIIKRCRGKVAARLDAPPVAVDVDHGVPMFLDQLLQELRTGASSDSMIARTATQHGRDLLAQGYTVSQVVHDYGDVCQAVTELAIERRVEISTDDFRTLNRCLDDAIAGAVTEYGHQRDRSWKRESTLRGERHGLVVHDLVKALDIAKFAFVAISSGRVGVAGSTGTVLGLGLQTANELADRLLADAPGQQGAKS
jgi:hypothetical protein